MDRTVCAQWAEWAWSTAEHKSISIKFIWTLAHLLNRCRTVSQSDSARWRRRSVGQSVLVCVCVCVSAFVVLFCSRWSREEHSWLGHRWNVWQPINRKACLFCTGSLQLRWTDWLESALLEIIAYISFYLQASNVLIIIVLLIERRTTNCPKRKTEHTICLSLLQIAEHNRPPCVSPFSSFP